MPQGDISKNAKFRHKNGCKGHQRSNFALAPYQKFVTRSTTCVKNFILVSQTAQGWYYAALLLSQATLFKF